MQLEPRRLVFKQCRRRNLRDEGHRKERQIRRDNGRLPSGVRQDCLLTGRDEEVRLSCESRGEWQRPKLRANGGERALQL
jgi:hypothetical protein